MRQTLLGLIARRGIGWLLYWLAQLLLPLGRPGRTIARPLLAAVLWLQPDYRKAQAYYNYLQALAIFPRGRTDEALELLRGAHRMVPDDEAVHLDWAVALTMANRYEQAIDVLEQLRRDDEKTLGEEQFWTALGWSYLRTGRFPLAEMAIKRADEYGVTSPDLRLIRLLALLAQDGWLDRDGLNKIVRQRPGSLGMILESASFLATTGHRAQSQELVEALPADILPRAWRIIVRQGLNDDDLETAQWSLERLEQIAADSTDTLMMHCEVAMRRGQMTEAVAKAHEAVADKRADLDVLETAGRVMVLAGQRKAAFEYMTGALAKGSRDALAGGVVALYMLAQDRLDDARSVFRVQRSGDELACLYAHTATAGVLRAEGDLPEAAVLATRTWKFWEELPPWARTAAVREDIVPVLREIGQAAVSSGDQKVIEDGKKLLSSISGTISSSDLE